MIFCPENDRSGFCYIVDIDECLHYHLAHHMQHAGRK